MPSQKKRLEWSRRAGNDYLGILRHYALNAPPSVVFAAAVAIDAAAVRLTRTLAVYRPGRKNTREYVMRRFPYIIVYRVAANKVRIVRVLHQSRLYFNR
ncbi:MAG: type II toxin-antitoxin system RelE/ParE family toxin [Sulfuritalea sp.]|jgi:plasmid stabilization system protein ParE|nr:type II toxin-antitoxin system RelE/ParE family toxin [Sulfuritalea sp.]